MNEAMTPAGGGLPPMQYVGNVQTAKIRSTRKTSLGGLALELIGFVLLFVYPFGTLIGLALIIAGFNASKAFRCGNCENFLADRKVKICPSCHCNLRK